MKVSATLPMILTCRDYHEFPGFNDIFKQLFPGERVKVWELGFDGYNYFGLVYIGKRSDALKTPDALKALAAIEQWENYG